jgi:hypothetical protein
MIRICRRLESETLYLPELKPLLGMAVEIIVRQQTEADVTPATGDWMAAQRAAERLRQSDYDFDAWREQREIDLKQVQDHRQ